MAQYNLEKLWIKKVAYALIAVGMVLQGVGKSTRYPFVTLYIDDSVDKRKTGFYMGISIKNILHNLDPCYSYTK